MISLLIFKKEDKEKKLYAFYKVIIDYYNVVMSKVIGILKFG